MKEFKDFELTKDSTLKIIGGNNAHNGDCDCPITNLGTISNDGDE